MGFLVIDRWRSIVGYSVIRCCLPTPPYLLGGVLPYLEVTGNSVPVS